jgi:hypothetical protein
VKRQYVATGVAQPSEPRSGEWSWKLPFVMVGLTVVATIIVIVILQGASRTP